VPIFEKPVIIRPKSTSDLLKLKHAEQIKPRDTVQIEQDLEARGGKYRGVEDDADFELWADNMEDEVERVALNKLQSHLF
jgi:hypothetical protein